MLHSMYNKIYYMNSFNMLVTLHVTTCNYYMYIYMKSYLMNRQILYLKKLRNTPHYKQTNKIVDDRNNMYIILVPVI